MVKGSTYHEDRGFEIGHTGSGTAGIEVGTTYW